MGVSNRQIGWSQESNLLWYVTKQLDRLTGVTNNSLSSIIASLSTKVNNDQGVPSFYADTFANRPAAGVAGRMFVATDTNQIYRDTGTVWNLISGGGSGVTTLAAIGSTPNANAATITGSTLNLEPASASFGGVVTTGAQTFAGTKTFTPAANTSAIVSSGYSLTGANDQSLIDVSGTWNTTGTPTLFRVNLTNTASNSASLLMDLRVGGNSVFTISRAGDVTAWSNINSSNFSYALTQGNTKTFTTQGVVAGNKMNFFDANSYTGTANVTHLMLSNAGFAPTSGTGTFIGIHANHTINQTGTATGITRGVYVQPVLTAVVDWRSIEWNNNTGWGLYGVGTAPNYINGSLGIRAATINASAALQVDSTTQGILPPRMSGAQAEAIASPAAGLLVYANNGNGVTITSIGWWGYNGTTWVRLNN